MIDISTGMTTRKPPETFFSNETGNNSPVFVPELGWIIPNTVQPEVDAAQNAKICEIID